MKENSFEMVNPGSDQKYERLRDDTIQFKIYRIKAHPQVGILVPPSELEVSESTLSEVLRYTVKNEMPKIIVDVSNQEPKTGISYARRIYMRSIKMKDITQIVTVGLSGEDDDFQEPKAMTLDKAVEILLESK